MGTATTNKTAKPKSKTPVGKAGTPEPAIDLAAYCLPVSKFISEKEKRVNRGVQVLKGRVDAVEQKIRHFMRNRSATITGQSASTGVSEELRQIAELRRSTQKLTRLIAGCEANYKNALPCEEDSWTNVKNDAKKQLNDAKELLKELERKHVTHLTTAAGAASERLQEEVAFLQKSAKLFPDSSVIDLSCLTRSLDNDLLPAQTLFDPSIRKERLSASDLVSGSYNGWRKEFANQWLPGSIRRRLGMQILTATGTTFDWLKESILKYPDSRKEGTGVKHVILDTSFSLQGRTVPPQARDIIRRAQQSKLYDNVSLLAEASWSVSYEIGPYKPREAPILEGSELWSTGVMKEGKVGKEPLRPKNYKLPPLILGIKRLESGRIISVCIGTFEVKPIERQVLDE